MSAALPLLAALGGQFLPTRISGLTGWWDASDTATLFQDSGLTTAASANNDSVGGWKDKSGNSRSFLQGTSNARPLLKTGVMGGRPVLRFDGSNDYLEGVAATTLIPLAAGTFVAVVNATANTNGSPYYTNSAIFADTSGGYIGLYPRLDSTIAAFQYPGTSLFASRSFTSAVPCIVVWRLGASVLSVAVNDTNFSSIASGTTTSFVGNLALARNYTGAQFLPCDIAEVATFNAAVSASDLALLITAWKIKYAIP